MCGIPNTDERMEAIEEISKEDEESTLYKSDSRASNQNEVSTLLNNG